MRSLRSLPCLFLLLMAVLPLAAQEEPSLGEVARQNQAAKKAAPDHIYDDQENKAAIPTPETSLCGEPLPLMQLTYAAAFTGQNVPSDEELSKSLLEWLDHHSDLQSMDPRQLANAQEPRTETQDEADRALAEKIAAMLTQEIVDFKPTHTDAEVQERIAKALAAKAPPRKADALIRAVRDEELRRNALAGKQPTESDRLSEAINLYSICENKRLIQSQGNVEQQSQLALRKKLQEAGFALPDATEPPASADGK